MVDYRFTLELTDYTVQKRVTVTQGEVAARRFIVNFSENGKPYALNPFSLVAFRMNTPTGKDIFDYCTVKGNSVEFIPTSVSVAENGLCDARIEIYGNETGSVLYSPKFEMYITEDKFRNSSVEGSDEFTALQKIATDYVSAMEELNGPQGVITTAKAQVELAKAEVENAKAEAEKSKSLALQSEENSSSAEASASKAATSATAAATSASNAATSASKAATSASNARSSALDAKEQVELAKDEMDAIKSDMIMLHGDAYQYSVDAKNSADRAEAAAESMTNVWQCVYANDTPKWVSHDASSVDPYASGNDLLFTGVRFEKDKKYKLQFDLKRSSAEYDNVFALVTVANGTNREDRISTYNLCGYNSTSGCYELEFIASRTVADYEQLMIFVQYPETHLGDKDYNAIYGSVYILYENHIKTVVAQNSEEIKATSSWVKTLDENFVVLNGNWLHTDARVFDLEDAVGDIETALDGIITLQENLIGGGN